jgi:hypothetical protein
MPNDDFEPTYTIRRRDNGRWCVLLTHADGSEREIGDFATDGEARHWIVVKGGKPIANSGSYNSGP